MAVNFDITQVKASGVLSGGELILLTQVNSIHYLSFSTIVVTPKGVTVSSTKDQRPTPHAVAAMLFFIYQHT